MKDYHEKVALGGRRWENWETCLSMRGAVKNAARRKKDIYG